MILTREADIECIDCVSAVTGSFPEFDYSYNSYMQDIKLQ